MVLAKRKATSLPIKPPFPPMEALSASAIPVGERWQYEPKWDGFRILAFKGPDGVYLQSKAGQPLGRYFPEIVNALAALKTQHFVLDGEMIVSIDGVLLFDELLMRIHPAASRIEKLSREHPATLVVFDLIVNETGRSLVDQPLALRRQALEDFAGRFLKGSRRFELSPKTLDLNEAKRWFEKMGGALDGVIAKNRDAAYQSGERSGVVQKIKNKRTADCVVGGFRYAEKPMNGKKAVGSLLLGLYNAQGQLDHIGFTSSIKDVDRQALTEKLEKVAGTPGFTGKAPGGPSRWSTRRSSEWQPLKTKLVVEVEYDHFSGGRFRHGTGLLRWRPDKAPAQCTLSQVAQERISPLTLLDKH